MTLDFLRKWRAELVVSISMPKIGTHHTRRLSEQIAALDEAISAVEQRGTCESCRHVAATDLKIAGVGWRLKCVCPTPAPDRLGAHTNPVRGCLVPEGFSCILWEAKG